MIKRFLAVFFVLFVGISGACAQQAIIPQPVNMEAGEGQLTIESEIGLVLDQENEKISTMLDNFAEDLKPLEVELSTGDGLESTASALLRISLKEEDSVKLGSEGYELSLGNGVINLQAIEPAGVFNGLQTLRQLLPQKRDPLEDGSYEPILIDAVSITDYPRFGWRGLMLDVSRHFFTVEEVKEYIDQMSKYKFNVFHWHLTDDEGWRVEIKAFPRLTEVGAWRVERHGKFGSGRPYPKKNEKATYGGFYTQDEIKDVIAYAAERNVTIIPEIDVPGHSMALLAAYPELSTRKELKFVNPGSKFANWFDDDTFEMTIENTLDPSNPAVYAFLDMIFGEIADLFPADYIHMGGDECYHGYWERDEKVQAFMKENGINDSGELQSYFVKRVEKIISDKGKKMIGWDEILEGGLADGAAVMSWRGMQGGIEAARSQHEVVMSPKEFVYLDYTQGDYSVENEIYADLSLEKAYSFDPMPNPNLFVDIDPNLILGGQGNLWTEEVPSLEFAFYMTYPRAFAISESLWSPLAAKDYENFLERTEIHFDRFDNANRSVSKTIYEPEVKLKMDGRKLMCTLGSSFEDIEMRYTVDNTYPVARGQKYEGPFEIPNGELELRVQSYRNGQPIGRMLIIDRKDLEERLKK
jgi:hexosaminidase